MPTMSPTSAVQPVKGCVVPILHGREKLIMLSNLPKQAQWGVFAAAVIFAITVVAGFTAILLKH